MKDFKTEAEATKLWCPHARIMVAEDVGGKDAEDWICAAANRAQMSEDNVKNDRCLASECMMWRWSHQDAGPNDPPTGFCGAAIAPKYI